MAEMCFFENGSTSQGHVSVCRCGTCLVLTLCDRVALVLNKLEVHTKFEQGYILWKSYCTTSKEELLYPAAA